MKMIIDISDDDIKWAYDYYKFPDIQSKINTENLARVIRNGIPVLADNVTNKNGKGIKEDKMTLDEAIIHCEEVADRCDVTDGNIKCANEHRQLAEWLKDYKRLKNQKPCEDCISRREAIKMFTYNYKEERIPDYDCDNWPVQIAMKTVKEILRELPSVNPQAKTGHWIRVDKDKLRCSECEVIHLIAQYPNGKIDWCPNCGAKMQAESEGQYGRYRISN